MQEKSSISVQQKPTAIVIDDDIDVVSVFCEYLSILDVDVLGCGHNGKDAMELYEQKKPDIVFLDLIMPEYDGFYALEKIKAANPEAKIVMLTSNASQTVAEKLQRLGSSRIIPKPFEANMIIDVIDELRNQDKHKPHPKEILVG